MDDLGLENTVTLGEVVHRDQDLYDEVCSNYGDLFGIAIQLLDDGGNRLIGVTATNPLCKKAFTISKCRTACQKIINSIRQEAPTFRTVTKKTCFCGAQYRIAPVHHETDVIGKLVLGPFRTAQLKDAPKPLLDLIGGPQNKAEWLPRMKAFPKLDGSLAEKIAHNLASVIEVMAFIGFKGQMTTDMHVLSTSEAYAELAAKNEELKQQAQVLRRRADLRTDFLSMMSGRLKAPLTNIIGYTEMLLEGLSGEVNDDQRMFLQTVMDYSEQMFSMVQTMDELSQIQRGQVETIPDVTDPVEMLQGVYETGRKLGNLHDVTVEFSATANLPPLWIDEVKAISAIKRIVENAVMFTPAGGRVLISANVTPDGAETQGGSFVSVAIADNGVGISQDDLPRVFEPFFTVGQSASVDATGGGIGLTIAKAYIEADGGKVKVKSKPGKGSTFFVYLPIVT